MAALLFLLKLQRKRYRCIHSTRVRKTNKQIEKKMTKNEIQLAMRLVVFILAMVYKRLTMLLLLFFFVVVVVCLFISRRSLITHSSFFFVVVDFFFFPPFR